MCLKNVEVFYDHPLNPRFHVYTDLFVRKIKRIVLLKGIESIF